MAGKDLTYTVGVDASDATSGLRRLESAVRSTMRTVDEEMEEGATAGEKLAASLDRVAAQAKEDLALAAVAAEELQAALKRAGSEMDVGDALSSLNRMGLSMDEVTADADKLATSLKQLDDVRAQGVADLDSVAPGLASKLDGVSKSAEGSRNALANMVGNSVQDVTGLSGALGVALGQLAEYGTDAKLAGEGLGSVFKGLAGVAGPIAGIALATQLLGNAMKAGAKSAELHADGVERVADAAEEGTGVVGALRKQIEETSKLEFRLGGGFDFEGIKVEDFRENLANLGLTLEDFAGFVGEDATGALEAFHDANRDVIGTNDDWVAMFVARDALNKQVAESELDRAINARIGAEADEEAAMSAEELAEARKEAAQAARDEAVANANARRELESIGSVFEEMARRGGALASVFALGNAPLDAAAASRDIAAGIADLAETAKGVKIGDILAGNLDGDAVLDALDALRPEVQSKIQEAFAAGGPQAASDTAAWYVESVRKSLGDAFTTEQVEDLLGLGDLEADIAVATKLSDVERVKAQLAVLTGVAGESPLTASIALALDAGTITPEAAELLVHAQLGQAGVLIPSTLDTPDTKAAQIEAGTFVMDLPTALDTSGAAEDATTFAREVERTPVTAPLDADTSDAEDERDAFVDETERTQPLVSILSETRQALATMQLLRFAAALLSPEVTVTANTAPAMLGIAAVAAQRPRVPVEAYLADYPSAAEIQARIGRPRIPVDIVVGSSIRITGVRE